MKYSKEVTKYYWNKPEEYYHEDNQKAPYIKVAKAIHKLPIGVSFEETINSLGMKDYIRESSVTSELVEIKNMKGVFCEKEDEDKRKRKEYRLTNEIQKKQYYVHEDYDDYVFAWLFYNRTDWDTVKLYNDLRMYNKVNEYAKMDFYTWFIRRCIPGINGEYHPGQKWHLFEYVLYSEINEKYCFSKSTGDLWNKTSHNGLWNWMAENAGVEKKKVSEQQNGVIEKILSLEIS